VIVTSVRRQFAQKNRPTTVRNQRAVDYVVLEQELRQKIKATYLFATDFTL
jgi:hypothetical protein